MLIDSPDRAREWLDSWKGHSSYRSYLKYAIDGFRTNLMYYEVFGYTETAETGVVTLPRRSPGLPTRSGAHGSAAVGANKEITWSRSRKPMVF